MLDAASPAVEAPPNNGRSALVDPAALAVNGRARSELVAELMERRRDVHALSGTIEAQEEELALRAQQLVERDQEIIQAGWTEAGLRSDILRLERHVAIIAHSKSFMLTAPLRRLATWRHALLDRCTEAAARLRHRAQILRNTSPDLTAAPDLTTLLPHQTDVGEQDPAVATSPARPVTIAGEERTALLAHPPCILSYRFTVPPRARCRVYVALLPEVWERVIDGVEFRLTAANVGGGEVATRSLVNSPGRLSHHRRWTELTLSLAQFAGCEVALTMRTQVPDGELAHFAYGLQKRDAACTRTSQPGDLTRLARPVSELDRLERARRRRDERDGGPSAGLAHSTQGQRRRSRIRSHPCTPHRRA